MSDKHSRWADPWFTERIGMLIFLGLSLLLPVVATIVGTIIHFLPTR